MTVTGIAARYAEALVGALANSRSGIDPRQSLEGLDRFLAALQDSRDLEMVLLSPAVNPLRKKAVIQRIAEALELDPLVRNLLFVLVEHRRINIVREIAPEADALLDEHLGFARAKVSSAAPLPPEQELRIAAALEALTGKRIRMRVRVDPDLIGGVMAQVGSRLYDGSVRGRLRALGERLGVT